MLIPRKEFPVASSERGEKSRGLRQEAKLVFRVRRRNVNALSTAGSNPSSDRACLFVVVVEPGFPVIYGVLTSPPSILAMLARLVWKISFVSIVARLRHPRFTPRCRLILARFRFLPKGLWSRPDRSLEVSNFSFDTTPRQKQHYGGLCGNADGIMLYKEREFFYPVKYNIIIINLCTVFAANGVVFGVLLRGKIASPLILDSLKRLRWSSCKSAIFFVNLDKGLISIFEESAIRKG